jgi:hypothetical protein
MPFGRIDSLNHKPNRKEIMASYFTNFSLLVPLPTEAAQKYAIDLAQQVSCINQGDEQMLDGFPDSLRDVVEDWQFDTDAGGPENDFGMWVHSSNGGIDAVCAFVQHLLKRFNPTAHITLEWSNDCSKPRTDAFGGGAALITATEIKSMNTRQWLDQQIAELPR